MNYMKGLKSLFLPILYIIYAAIPYEDIKGRRRILPLSTGAQELARKIKSPNSFILSFPIRFH